MNIVKVLQLFRQPFIEVFSVYVHDCILNTPLWEKYEKII